MAQALRQVGLASTSFDLLSDAPYPPDAAELKPLRLALGELAETAKKILACYGFTKEDIAGIELSARPAHWDSSGYVLHTRTVVAARDGRKFDSGWLQ
ncbi:MAG: hypothetical protein V4787_03600 [Pseudomonadota bacterium]